MYMLFGDREEYYPSGGMNDLIGYFDTEKEAVDHAKVLLMGDGLNSWVFYEWVHVYDLNQKKIVFAVGNPYGNGQHNPDRRDFIKEILNEK